MIRTILIPAVLAGLLALLTAAQAHAYGAVHTGYTAAGPNGVAHYGTTAAVGPYGAAEHTGAYTAGPNGAEYHGTTVYSPSMYNGYSAVGTTSAYGNGAVVHSTTVYP